MKSILIDGGGTSTKGYYFDGTKITDSVKTGSGNLVISFEDGKQNILNAIKYFDLKDAKIYIFTAGFMNLVEKDKEIFKRDILNQITENEVVIMSDAFLPLFISRKKVAAITLGTGTAFIHNAFGKEEVIFGYGHLIKDPLSGYSLAQNIIFDVLTNGTNDQKNILYKHYEVVSQAELIKKIYSNPVKTTISDPFGNIIHDEALSIFVDNAIKTEINFFMTDKVKETLKAVDDVVLNGSVACEEKIASKLISFVNPNANIIYSSDREELIKKIMEVI